MDVPFDMQMDKLRQDIASAKEGERIVVHKSGPEAGTEVP